MKATIPKIFPYPVMAPEGMGLRRGPSTTRRNSWPVSPMIAERFSSSTA